MCGMIRSNWNKGLEAKKTALPLCLQGYLLYRDTSNHTMSAIKINPETLEPDGTVIMPGTERAASECCSTRKNEIKTKHNLSFGIHSHFAM